MEISLLPLKSQLILGSRSPRRRALFTMLGLDFICRQPKYSEDMSVFSSENPATIPKILAEKKALSLSDGSESRPVISYDTAVIHRGRILGKPAGPKDAQVMLANLSGDTHTVVTGLSLAVKGHLVFSSTAKTEVDFVEIDCRLIEKYAQSDEPLDKAGSYAIQGKGAIFVKEIKGCYYNVVGLPIQLTLRALKPYLSSLSG